MKKAHSARPYRAVGSRFTDRWPWVLELHDVGYNIDLVFFGCYCLAMGYLIFRSAYFPRILGALMAFAGLSYLTNSSLSFIAPALATQRMPYILLPTLGELVLALWLLVRGINRERWNKFHPSLFDA